MAKKASLWNVYRFWKNKYYKYRNFREEEYRQKTVYFGVQSIIETIIGLVVIGLSIWGIIELAHALSLEMGILQILGMVVLAGIILNALIYCPIQALVCLIFQLLLNRRAVGWVALAFWILSIISYCVEIVLLVTNIL